MKSAGNSGQLAFIFPGRGRFPNGPAVDEKIQSRLCEQVWLEPDLFESDSIVVLFEEFLPTLTALFGRPISPGDMGEQMVVRGIDPSLFTVGARVTIGDAVFQVASGPTLKIAGGTSDIYPKEMPATLPACRLIFIEEGLVEPGSPLSIE